MCSHKKKNRINFTSRQERISDVFLQITTGPNNNAAFDHYPYLAYARNGTVEGQLVYANNGQDQDFEELAKMNIDVRGKIVIIRSRNVSSVTIKNKRGESFGLK